MATAAAPITERDAIDAVAEILAARGIDWGTVTGQTHLRDIGLDSVELAELFMILEEISQVRLNPESAADIVIVADLTGLTALDTVDA